MDSAFSFYQKQCHPGFWWTPAEGTTLDWTRFSISGKANKTKHRKTLKDWKSSRKSLVQENKKDSNPKHENKLSSVLLTSRVRVIAITQINSLQGGSYFFSISIFEWTINLGLDENTFKSSMYPNPPANSKTQNPAAAMKLVIIKRKIKVACEGGAVWYNTSRELWGNDWEHFNKPILGCVDHVCLAL